MYTRTNWENGSTPLNATNMNNIEDGIEEALVVKHGHKHIAIPANGIGATGEQGTSTLKYYATILDSGIIADILNFAEYLNSKTVRNLSCRIVIGNAQVTGVDHLDACEFDRPNASYNGYNFMQEFVTSSTETGFIQWTLNKDGYINMNVSAYIDYIRQLGITFDFYYDYEEPITE